MSVQHIAMVLEASGLCAQEKAALVAFCNHTDATGKTFAGEERLMREAGMPRTTFQRWRAKLVERELLFSKARTNAKNQRLTSDTWVNLRLLAEMRDQWFDRPGRPADEEDMNPFDSQAPSVEPGSKPGPVSGADQAPSVGPSQAPSVEPLNPQMTLTSSIAREDSEPIGSVAGVDTATDDDGLTPEDIYAIASEVTAVRTEWHKAGVIAQLRQVQHLSVTMVRDAFVEAASNQSLHTPMHLASAAFDAASRVESAAAAAVRREHNNQALRAEIAEDRRHRADPDTRKARAAEARELMNARKRAG